MLMKLKSFMRQTIGLTAQSLGAWRYWSGGGTKSGQSVTPESAMQLTAVFRAVRLTSSTVASLPIKIYRNTSSGPEEVTDTTTARLLRYKPNSDQTVFEFIEQLVACQELLGEGFARKVRGISGDVVSLQILHPSRMVDRDNSAGTGYFWEYTDPKGSKHILQPDDVLHLRGFSMVGRRGVSPIAVCREAVGMAQAANETAANLFATGMRNSGFITTNAVFQGNQRAELQEIMERSMGTSGMKRLMILEAGMDFKALNMNAQDAELLMTRKFEIEELGRMFDMPPILLGHSGQGQTMWGSGVSAIIKSWLSLGLRQRIRRLEQMLDARLLSSREQAQGLYVKVNIDALLSADMLERIEVLSRAVLSSLMTPDEARAKLELGSMPGGDKLLAQTSLAPLATLGDNDAPADGLKSAFIRFLGIGKTDEKRPEIDNQPPEGV